MPPSLYSFQGHLLLRCYSTPFQRPFASFVAAEWKIPPSRGQLVCFGWSWPHRTYQPTLSSDQTSRVSLKHCVAWLFYTDVQPDVWYLWTCVKEDIFPLLDALSKFHLHLYLFRCCCPSCFCKKVQLLKLCVKYQYSRGIDRCGCMSLQVRWSGSPVEYSLEGEFPEMLFTINREGNIYLNAPLDRETQDQVRRIYVHI